MYSLESCSLVISHILALFGLMRRTKLCIICSLKWIIRICSKYYCCFLNCFLLTQAKLLFNYLLWALSVWYETTEQLTWIHSFIACGLVSRSWNVSYSNENALIFLYFLCMHSFHFSLHEQITKFQRIKTIVLFYEKFVSIIIRFPKNIGRYIIYVQYKQYRFTRPISSPLRSISSIFSSFSSGEAYCFQIRS